MLRALLFCLALPAMAQDRPFAGFDLASAPVLSDPHDLAIGPDGRLYVADKFAGRIAVFDPETLELVGSFGAPLPGVHDISFGPDGRAYVAVTGTSQVVAFDLSGPEPQRAESYVAPRTEGALAHTNGMLYAMAGGTGELALYRGQELIGTAGGMFGAHDVAEAPDGSVWVADNFNRRLVRFSQSLDRLQVLNAPKFGFVGPRYLDVTETGLLVVADQDAHRVLLIDPDGAEGGTLLGVIGDGSPGMGPGKFDDPEGVAVDGTRFFFADSDNNRIVRYSIVLN